MPAISATRFSWISPPAAADLRGAEGFDEVGRFGLQAGATNA